MTLPIEKEASAGIGMQCSLADSWFALRVKFRHEKLVSRILTSKGFEQFLPVYRSKRKWVDRVKEIDLPLFPGYVFSRFKPESWIAVMATPGVIEIVRRGARFAPVDPAEIAALQAQMKSFDRAPEFYLAVAPSIIGLLAPRRLETRGQRLGLVPFQLKPKRDPRMDGTTSLDLQEPVAEGNSRRRVRRVTPHGQADLN